jgi:hypothetical protein
MARGSDMDRRVFPSEVELSSRVWHDGRRRLHLVQGVVRAGTMSSVIRAERLRTIFTSDY